MIAYLYFPPSERLLAITIGTYSGSLGSALSFIFSPLYLQGVSSDEELEQKFEELFLIKAIIMTIPLLMSIVVKENREINSNLLENENVKIIQLINLCLTNQTLMYFF